MIFYEDGALVIRSMNEEDAGAAHRRASGLPGGLRGLRGRGVQGGRRANQVTAR